MRAQLVFACAAAITLGRFMLLLSELFQVGEGPRWVESLNLLESFGLDLAIVAHGDNVEGRNHDTRICFMGEPRMKILERLLPSSVVILSVEQTTACTIDLRAAELTVAGVGQVAVRHGGHEHDYPAGAYPLEGLKQPAPRVKPVKNVAATGAPAADSAERLVARANLARVDFTRAPVAAELEAAAPQIGDLLEALDESPISGGQAALPDQTRAVVGALVRGWRAARDNAPAVDTGAVVDPYVELLIGLRAKLLRARQWAPADEARDGLAGSGVLLEARSGGTTWRRV